MRPGEKNAGRVKNKQKKLKILVRTVIFLRQEGHYIRSPQSHARGITDLGGIILRGRVLYGGRYFMLRGWTLFGGLYFRRKELYFGGLFVWGWFMPRIVGLGGVIMGFGVQHVGIPRGEGGPPCAGSRFAGRRARNPFRPRGGHTLDHFEESVPEVILEALWGRGEGWGKVERGEEVYDRNEGGKPDQPHG